MSNGSKTEVLSPIPGHTNETTRSFCSREGQMSPGGRCPDGCDHADHYSNDGHPECEDAPVHASRYGLVGGNDTDHDDRGNPL